MGVSIDSAAEDDLRAIYQGGENFLARMKALTDQRSAIESMLAELQLGRAVREAYDDARKLQAQADDALSAARAAANAMTTSAAEAAAKTTAEADAYSKSARADADAAKASAESLRATAIQYHADAAEVKKNSDRFLAEVSAAKDAAVSAKDRADQVTAIFKTALDQASRL